MTGAGRVLLTGLNRAAMINICIKLKTNYNFRPYLSIKTYEYTIKKNAIPIIASIISHIICIFVINNIKK